MKKPFLGSWEGLKREKLVQILNFSQSIMSHKSQFSWRGGGRRSNFNSTVPEDRSIRERGIKSPSIPFKYHANLLALCVDSLEYPFLDSFSVVFLSPERKAIYNYTNG